MSDLLDSLKFVGQFFFIVGAASVVLAGLTVLAIPIACAEIVVDAVTRKKGS